MALNVCFPGSIYNLSGSTTNCVFTCHATEHHAFNRMVHRLDRLVALDELDILDSPAEPDFDDIVFLASSACDTPVSLISFVAADRQWFKARVGFEACETPIEQSVCQYALTSTDLLVIPDLTKNVRTKANRLVTHEPKMRFYAGAPLMLSSGLIVGTLCVIDSLPREQGLNENQSRALAALARHVVLLLESRQAANLKDSVIKRQKRATRRLLALNDIADKLRDIRELPDMALAAAGTMSKALNVTRIGFALVDTMAQTVTILPDWRAAGLSSLQGQYRVSEEMPFVDKLQRGDVVEVFDTVADPLSREYLVSLSKLGIRGVLAIPVLDQTRLDLIAFATRAVPRRWTAQEKSFVRAVGDRLQIAIARLRAESLQNVLNHELSHRLKNSLSVVQAIATQTLRKVADKEAVESFQSRLMTLSRAHDLLLQDNWTAASVSTTVSSVIGSHGSIERYELEGVHAELGPRGVLSLSLILHELATNASKYGSLSVATGKVIVRWWIDGQDNAVFRLRWREEGGPPAAIPKSTGFGTRLIKSGLAGTGGVELDYTARGLVADFAAPLSAMRLG